MRSISSAVSKTTEPVSSKRYGAYRPRTLMTSIVGILACAAGFAAFCAVVWAAALKDTAASGNNALSTLMVTLERRDCMRSPAFCECGMKIFFDAATLHENENE